MSIRNRIAWIAGHPFLRPVGVLVGGTGLAAALSAMVLPVITRFYTPHDFSALAVLSGIVSIVSVAACLRFEVAIPMPEHDEDAANVLGLALLSCLVVSLAVAIAALATPEPLLLRLNQGTLAPYRWLLPFGVLLAASCNALQFWFVRKRQFSGIAASRIAQTAAGAATQVGFGLAGGNTFGLLLGQVLNVGAGSVTLGYRLLKSDAALLRTIAWPRMKVLFRIYDRFPKYSTLEALSNAAGAQLPVILIAGLTPGAEAGLLFLALFVMQAPMGLLGNAVAQVYVSRAPEEFRGGRLGAFTVRIVGGLMKVGVGPLIFGGIIAPALSGVVFGSEWHRAGVLMAWMTPWFVMQFLASPVSMALHVTSQQKAAFVLQLFGLLLRVASVYAAFALIGGFISESYALSGFAFYLAYLLVVFAVVRTPIRDVLRELRGGLPIVLMWAAAGLAIAVCFALLGN